MLILKSLLPQNQWTDTTDIPHFRKWNTKEVKTANKGRMIQTKEVSSEFHPFKHHHSFLEDFTEEVMVKLAQDQWVIVTMIMMPPTLVRL
jgi:NADPH-dependent 7-cyano-7-deazaguanine reductase QueF